MCAFAAICGLYSEAVLAKLYKLVKENILRLPSDKDGATPKGFAITAVTPDHWHQGVPVKVTIDGLGFKSGMRAYLDNQPLATTEIDGDTVCVEIPGRLLSSAGDKQLTLHDQDEHITPIWKGTVVALPSLIMGAKEVLPSGLAPTPTALAALYAPDIAWCCSAATMQLFRDMWMSS